ncbi:hypothetical protein GCM10020000_42400 [Streptomyces olivoverticillatus]
MLVPYEGAPHIHAELEKALHTPSLYDEVLRFLFRRGHGIPASVREREAAERHAADPAVEDVWQRIYAGDQHSDECRAGRGADRGRGAGVALAQRPPGGDETGDGRQGGHGGITGGVAWLEKRAAKSVFPELWTARSRV